MLVALAWSSLAFCDEIPATSEASPDQLRLATLALESSDYKVRKDAVNELTDQTLLAKIASDDDNWVISQAAAQKLTNQVLLEKVALDSKWYQARIPAIDKVKNESVLSKIALESHETGIVLAALSNVTNRTVLATVAGDMAAMTFRAPEAAARLCLALQDPIIVARMPDSHAFFSWQHVEQEYQRGLSKDGETVHFAIKQGSKICAEDDWATVFSSYFYATYSNHSLVPDRSLVAARPAHVDTSTMLNKLLWQPQFKPEDFLKLAGSQIPEVRLGALSRVTDEALLKKVMAEDINADVRRAAEHDLDVLRAGGVAAFLPGLKLVNIMDVPGQQRAIFTIQPSTGPGKQPGYLKTVVLKQGERSGLLEVLELHPDDGMAKIKFDGQIYTITTKGEIVRVKG
jgi:hypothetical protein